MSDKGRLIFKTVCSYRCHDARIAGSINPYTPGGRVTAPRPGVRLAINRWERGGKAVNPEPDGATEIADQLEVGSGVRIDGTVEEYPAGSRQVRIERLVPVEIVHFEDFLPRAKRDLEEMRAELTRVRPATWAGSLTWRTGMTTKPSQQRTGSPAWCSGPVPPASPRYPRNLRHLSVVYYWEHRVQ
jgi:hypothetical protein